MVNEDDDTPFDTVVDGTFDVNDPAELIGKPAPIAREEEGALYERILRERYVDAERILENAGHWEGGRVVAG